jgi:hypothetical protein
LSKAGAYLRRALYMGRLVALLAILNILNNCFNVLQKDTNFVIILFVSVTDTLMQ